MRKRPAVNQLRATSNVSALTDSKETAKRVKPLTLVTNSRVVNTPRALLPVRPLTIALALAASAETARSVTRSIHVKNVRVRPVPRVLKPVRAVTAANVTPATAGHALLKDVLLSTAVNRDAA